MASLLNNASLLFNPAGSIISYQEDKIYSVLPKDGTGDFTFSGGDGGTRVNQQGYVEVTPANLINQSEAIGSSPWILNDTSLTANSTAAPNGTTTADTIANNGNNAAHRVYQGPFTGYGSPQTMSFSLYVKYNNHQYFSFGLTDDSVYRSQVVVDLVNGTITQNFVNTGGDTLTSTITNVGGGWYYVTGTFTYATSLIGGNAYFLCMLLNQSTFTSAGYVGTGTSVFVWGAMFNTGGVKPYQPTTDRLNYPRITYQNGRGALLSEPQRTNLTRGSNGLTTNWTNYRGTYTANAITSPDGTVNAPRTVWDGSSPSTVGFYFTNFSFAGSTTYCFSVFLKYYNKPVVAVGYVDRSGPYLGGNAYFNIANGTFVSVDGSATTGIIEPYKDGWYRCTVVFTTTASPSYNYLQIDCDVDTTGEGFYVYGSQLEIGSYPTSYIPTTSATVTRPQDVGGKSVPSIVNTSAGTLYLDVTIKGTLSADQFYWGIYDGSGNQIYIGLYSIYGLFRIANSYSLDVNFNPVFELNKRYKFAFAYQTNDAVAYMNGNSVGSDTSVSIPSVTSMGINFLNENANIESYTLAYFNSRLTNTQLAELTTVRSGSGGNISYYGPYTIHTFTGSATFTPSFSGQVEVLVVAGGGGGGARHGGGGGAGGLIYASSYGVSQGTGITVTVGAGGPGVNNGGVGDCGINGSNSVFGGLTAIGGGGGGSYTNPVPTGGASGGGGGGGLNTTPGGSIAGQGNPGGTGGAGNGGGGGGGAGAAGSNAAGANTGGNGGNGLPYSITGYSTYYAGGGGGGSQPTQSNNPGGLGGGGTGDGQNQNGGTGVAYTGGGGGGTRSDNVFLIGGTGGSGVVIVRYLT